VIKAGVITIEFLGFSYYIRVIPMIIFYRGLLAFREKANIKLNEKDYFDFLQISNEFGLTVEEKIYEIIYYHLIIQRKRIKFSKNG